MLINTANAEIAQLESAIAETTSLSLENNAMILPILAAFNASSAPALALMETLVLKETLATEMELVLENTNAHHPVTVPTSLAILMLELVLLLLSPTELPVVPNLMIFANEDALLEFARIKM